jgi:hypothetical protein
MRQQFSEAMSWPPAVRRRNLERLVRQRERENREIERGR